MAEHKRETVEGWKAIADLWGVDERTARRWAARRRGLVRKHALTGRVFGYRDTLVAFKTAEDEGEPLGLVDPGKRPDVPAPARVRPDIIRRPSKQASAY